MTDPTPLELRGTFLVGDFAEDHHELRDRRVWERDALNLALYGVMETKEVTPSEDGDEVDRAVRTTLYLTDGSFRVVRGHFDDVLDLVLEAAEAFGGSDEDWL